MASGWTGVGDVRQDINDIWFLCSKTQLTMIWQRWRIAWFSWLKDIKSAPRICVATKSLAKSSLSSFCDFPDSKVHGANMGPTWVLPAPDGPHVGPMNLAIRVYICYDLVFDPVPCEWQSCRVFLLIMSYNGMESFANLSFTNLPYSSSSMALALCNESVKTWTFCVQSDHALIFF